MFKPFSERSLQELYQALMARYELYHIGTNYLLSSLSDYQALTNKLRPLFVVTDMALKPAFTITTNTELFVSLTQLSLQHKLHFKIASGSTPTGSQPGADLWLRQAAAKRLCQAAELLQLYEPNYAFCITDAYRPLQLQRQHFEHIRSQLKAKGVPATELYHQTVGLIADPDLLPPHSTGGTVDITIYDRKTNEPINMGSVIDSIEVPLIHTWYSNITAEQRHNRMVLCTVLTAVGFKSTPLEWWHYSYGDLEWALYNGLTATIYDSVEDLDESLIKP